MDGKTDSIKEFFNQLWSFATEKHNQGIYNTVCLVVILTLPLLVFLTILVVCCHCCCCRHGGSRRCCGATTARSETKKKKCTGNGEDDLWISVKTGPTTPDRVALNML